MDSRTIDQLLRSNPVTKPHYGGCFPSDMLPTPNQYPMTLVANLDPAALPGSHWVVIYIESPDSAYYFCPFGDPPRGILLRYLSRFTHVVRNICKFQPTDSLACGYFALYVVYRLSQGLSFPQVLTMLSHSANPDLMVQLFIKVLKNKSIT